MAKSESKDVKTTSTTTQVQAISDSFNETVNNVTNLSDSQNVSVTFPGDNAASGVLSGLLPHGLDLKTILFAAGGVAVLLLGLKYFVKR